jgi:mRNA-degrading endonuclease RelE of RelBE toxin-antitoxin system
LSIVVIYTIKQTEEFSKEFNKLPGDIRKRFETQLRKVAINPYFVGKQINYTWFRELKNNIYRIYYHIYAEKIVVFLVGISDKKNQQHAINFIKHNLKNFRKLVDK